MDNGVATADMNPGQLAPTMDDQLQWPLWGMYYLSHGSQGKAPDLPEAIELTDLLGRWQRSGHLAERTEIWQKMLSIYSQQVFSIGLVNGTLQPIVRSSRLQNVPEKGLYGFDPTSYLGIYMPDTFWLSEEQV
jgi:peptide/nickel transport system substrate-binding protein